jgi:hypothetical protein
LESLLVKLKPKSTATDVYVRGMRTPHHIKLNSFFHDYGGSAKILLVSLLNIWSWMHIMEKCQ